MPRIICEVGKNFLTRPDDTIASCFQQAKFLVKEARKCGAETVKFQIHWPDEIEKRKRDPKRDEWIKQNIKLTPFNEFWKPLKRYCDEVGIQFLVTPMSKGAARKINSLVDEWKVGSADITDIELLEYLNFTGKPIILSSGMSTLPELDEAVVTCNPQTVLHCMSIYPCPLNKAHLARIPFLQRRYPGRLIGYSDHTLGFQATLGAVLLGAKVIEKHMTLTPDAYGLDHKMSITPDQFKEMVFSIGQIKEMLGAELKGVEPEEEELRKVFRYEKDIVSSNS